MFHDFKKSLKACHRSIIICYTPVSRMCYDNMSHILVLQVLNFHSFLQELGKNWKTFENEDAAGKNVDRVDDGDSDNRWVVSVFQLLLSYIIVSYQVDWMLESIHFPRGPSMYGIIYQLTVYMLVV